jgi:copper chaperone CopZ
MMPEKIASAVETMIPCTLCQIAVPPEHFRVGDMPFCCPGCQAVYTILSSKNQLADFQSHPLFTQAVKAGLISNPLLLETLRAKGDEGVETEKIHLEIHEMWCPSCAEIIQWLLLQEKGVKACIVDYSTDLASIEFYPRYLAKEKILELISSFGYRPHPLQNLSGRPVSSALMSPPFLA